MAETASAVVLPGLTVMPVEILSQIVEYIDFSSLLKAMQACQKMYSVIVTTRKFWCNLIGKLCKNYGVSPPEESLGEYTTVELERWVMQRRRCRDVFSNSVEPCFRQRRLPEPDNDGLPPLSPQYIELLPGGRWLLVAYSLAPTVYALDLDSPQPRPQILFDPREFDQDINDQASITYRAWIDKKASRLSLRVAGFIQEPRKSRIYIHQVDLKGHGKEAILVATVIATFRVMWRGWRACTSNKTMAEFNDRYFAQAGDNFASEAEIEIYDYRHVFGRLDYPWIEWGVNHHRLTLHQSLGKDPIIDITDEGGRVIIDCSTGDPRRLLHVCNLRSANSLALLHSIPVSYQKRSKARCTPKASFITLLNEEKLRGVVIPHDMACLPTVVELCSCGPELKSSRLALGTWASLGASLVDGTTWMVSHEWNFKWEVEKKSAPIGVTAQAVSLPLQKVAIETVSFDEDTGRLVHQEDGGSWLIVDA